jgi:2,3-dimethylmalate lyase
MSTTAELRSRLARPDILVAPGVYDALMAKLVETAGFEAVYMTGAGVSQSTLAQPDLGLVSFSEMLARASQIAYAVEIPLIADADTGYGNALNVQRTVREYERAGVAAIQLEDQTYPKRCGHFTGREVVPAAEMVGKIRAAVDARTDEDFQIIARTDARTSHGLSEALERAQMYEEAGADIIFVESPESREEMRAAASCVDSPTMANMVEGGRTPMLPARELQELGYSFAIFPGSVGRAATWAVSRLLEELKSNGDTSTFADRMYDIKTLNSMLGLKEFDELSDKYSADRLAARSD